MYSDKYDYNLTTLEIADLKYLEKKEILNFFKAFKNKSIFLIPIKRISEEIILNKWITNIQIKSDYKNTLKINIEEEIPFGIYIYNDQKLLFSSNLVILEIVQDKKIFPDLITFYGENSIINSKKLLLSFDKEFFKIVNSAIYIKKRRWNIILKNDILLKFPEIQFIDAINNYKKIYANLSNKDLKEIKSIDLRIKNQAIIKYKD